MIVLDKVKFPEKEIGLQPVQLTDDTMSKRKEIILSKMNEQNFDSLVIWADLEHGGNFEYLVGFLPRFEEALLILHKDGSAQLVLGNENLNKASKSRIKADPIHSLIFLCQINQWKQQKQLMRF